MTSHYKLQDTAAGVFNEIRNHNSVKQFPAHTVPHSAILNVKRPAGSSQGGSPVLTAVLHQGLQVSACESAVLAQDVVLPLLHLQAHYTSVFIL